MATEYENIVNKLLATNKTGVDNEATTQPKLGQALEDQINKKYALTNDKIGNNSVFDDIQAKIDLDSNNLEEDLKKIMKQNNSGKWTEEKDLWNESVKSAVKYMLDKFLKDDAYIPIDPSTGLGSSSKKGFLISDIRKANAGLSFSGSPWVRPNYNIDWDGTETGEGTYDGVRGTDKIEKVLNNHDHMQFTRTQNQDDVAGEESSPISKYIRLLMPQYTRRVEVEDLNRNFWVIGQVMAAISAYLFDEDSPITNMFKRLISEINQLWENVLYLWVNQNRPITKVHTEVVYLPNNNSQCVDLKFDGFYVNDSVNFNFDNIDNLLNYLVDQYSDSNLCILPIVRAGNYYKNYYNAERYFGVWFYDRNKQEWSYQTPPSDGAIGYYGKYLKNDDNNLYHLDFSPNLDKCAGLNIDEEDFVYNFHYPASDIDDFNEKSYYMGVRVIPSGSCKYDANTGIFSGGFSFFVRDYSLVAINDTETKYREDYVWGFGSTTSGTGLLNVSMSSFGTPHASGTKRTVDIENGFYLGELPSARVEGIPVISGLQVKQYEARPIKNRLLDFFDSTKLNQSPMINLQNNTEAIINQISGTEEVPTLRVGRYRVNGDTREAGKGSPGIFWATDGGNTYVTHEYTANKFGNSSGYYKVLNVQPNVAPSDPVTFITSSSEPAATFRGDLYIGAKLILPDFSPAVEYIYPEYVRWGCVTPLVNSNGIDTCTDKLGDNAFNVVTPLSSTMSTNQSNFGRKYKTYAISEFFKKNQDEAYGPDNWVVRYTQISVVYGDEIVENYQKKFWKITSSKTYVDHSKFKEHYYQFDESRPMIYYGVAARVAVHYFSAENNQPQYYRKEYNRLYQNGNKLAWRHSYRWEGFGNDSSLTNVDNYNPEIVGSDFNYYKPKYFNFVKYPINGYSR